MGKARDLFKKIRDTKGTFHAKMGLIKDRKGMDLTQADDIKKRWQEYTEEHDMSIATPAFFWSLFAWNIFFQSFTFSLYVSPVLRWVYDQFIYYFGNS